MTTTYFRNIIAGNVFNVGSQPEFPAEYYIGLSSTEPNESGLNSTEPDTSGTGYTRVKLDHLSNPENGVIKNQSDISFVKAETDWFPSGSPATHYVIFDALSNGNLVIYGELKKPRTIESDTYISFPAGELTISVV